jgi:hypothetical protein
MTPRCECILHQIAQMIAAVGATLLDDAYQQAAVPFRCVPHVTSITVIPKALSAVACGDDDQLQVQAFRVSCSDQNSFSSCKPVEDLAIERRDGR